MKKASIGLLCALFVLATACKGTKEVTKAEPVKDESQLTQQEEPVTLRSAQRYQGEYQAERTRENDLIHTKLEISFNWEKQYAYGKAELLFTPYFYPQKTTSKN